ncbi:MAG: hypothetical protein H0U74_10935 [Bradymonadaceae bacterium]|nr:hypothetical protein [Lujinxingiaceae bacterium]
MLGRDDIAEGELRERLVYSLIQAGIRLAARSGLSLKELTNLLRIGYFHEFRSQDYSLAEICEALDISIATAARLSKSLKTNFFQPEQEHELPQRIEYMLWAEPLSAPRINQVLPKEQEADVLAAVEILLRDGRIEEHPEHEGVYRLVARHGRLVRENWFSRVGALNSLLRNLVTTVEARFFEPEKASLSRTLNFRIHPDQVDELQRFYDEKLWPTMARLDDEAGDQGHKHVQLSVFWVVTEQSK